MRRWWRWPTTAPATAPTEPSGAVNFSSSPIRRDSPAPGTLSRSRCRVGTAPCATPPASRWTCCAAPASSGRMTWRRSARSATPACTFWRNRFPVVSACVPTSSMGRLFDAVASLLGVCQQVTYEGQAAVELEHLARRGDRRTAGIRRRGRAARPGAADRRDSSRGCGPASIAPIWPPASTPPSSMPPRPRRVRSRGRPGSPAIGLTGGVFVNRILLSGLRTALIDSGFDVLTHEVLPCNDGGIALGQAVIAAASSEICTEGSGVCASEFPAR